MKFCTNWRWSERGFTLVEMMIGLVIVSIGMFIAFPNFQGMVARNSIATQVNEMLVAVNVARSEAARRGAGVSVMPVLKRRSSQAGEVVCEFDASNQFNCGWCVLATTNEACCAEVPIPAGDTACQQAIVRDFPMLSNNAVLNRIDGNVGLQFSALGGVLGDTSLSLDFCMAGQEGRRIFISPIGRLKSHSSEDPIEARQPDC